MSDKIMVDRRVLEQALDMFERGRFANKDVDELEALFDALRAALEQPQVESELLEALKQVEHQLRWLDHPALDAAREAIAKTIEQPQDIAYQEAVHLAKWLFKKHFAHEEDYASGRVVWEPCDTTAGVISQIDNMVCTLVRPKSEDDKEYDWRDLYQKQKRRAEMWIAKYEKDVGMLDVAVPVSEQTPSKSDNYLNGYCVGRTDLLEEQSRAEYDQAPVAQLYVDQFGTLKLAQTSPPPRGAFPVYAHQQPVDDIVAGALFDFMGWLTSRSERLVLSSTDLATPAVDAIVDFAEMRGLRLTDARVKDWNDKTLVHFARSTKSNASQR